MLGRILFVCTGNQCRSPAAEMILRHHLGAGSVGYEIWSAGTRAPDGVGLHPLTAKALEHVGVPVRRHASRRITVEDVQGADLVLCATRQHRAEVASLMRGASAKTFTICEFARITRSVDGAHDSSLSEMVSVMSRRRVLDHPREATLDDLADPIGGGPQQHRVAVELLDMKCREIVDRLKRMSMPRQRGKQTHARDAPLVTAFLYTSDWSHEFRAFDRGLVPSHRLFGAADVTSRGISVRTCTWGRLPKMVRRPQAWKLWQAMWLMMARDVQCAVATTEASALLALGLRALIRRKMPIIVMTVAVLGEKYRHGLGAAIRRSLLRKADLLITYASSQCDETAHVLGLDEGRVVFIPFGVDLDFFPGEAARRSWDVVSAGTNSGKDYETLIRALPPQSSCLIVTDAENQEKILKASGGKSVVLAQNIPIVDLRKEYVSARSCVIPLRSVPYSSGQTILLEMMASGCDVIVSDAPAIRDHVSDQDAVTVVPCGDAEALASAIRCPRRTGGRAREHVRDHFSSQQFGKRLSEYIISACG